LKTQNLISIFIDINIKDLNLNSEMKNQEYAAVEKDFQSFIEKIYNDIKASKKLNQIKKEMFPASSQYA
jgi:hypothetical protein